ncbi:reverse transcriptase [Gossypium australe]|uniref:Reverse transcriptase n=1 Tax=Gossypium australe TaxID=47621 RepID=A0A5B6V1U4_9ROSI|nr:reverse transcriptase [Gossypium australe]
MGNPVTVREFRQLLVANSSNLVFVSETKINVNAISHISSLCRMVGCLAVSSKGKSGGLALMWKEGTSVSIQSYSKFHVDALVDIDDGKKIQFTGFYGQSDPTLRKQAWDMLRRIKGCVREGWVVGGDFNDILNEAEKEGGRRKPKTPVREFMSLWRNFLWWTSKLGWDGSLGVTIERAPERLDRVLVTEDVIEDMPFLETRVVRQSKSDHDAILFDTVEGKPRERGSFHKRWFRYDMCWAKEREAKDIINNIWSNLGSSFIDKIRDVKNLIGPWQFKQRVEEED